jgi:hypothetical protein
VLFALTGAFMLLAGFALSNLFDDYKDSPDSMFIETAAQVFGVALVCCVGGIIAPRNGSSTRSR